MADSIRYGKPNMANLPTDLGKKIFKRILNTPVPDRTKMRTESAELLKAMIKERDKEDAERNTAK